MLTSILILSRVHDDKPVHQRKKNPAFLILREQIMNLDSQPKIDAELSTIEFIYPGSPSLDFFRHSWGP
jgi:hypothetical protein